MKELIFVRHAKSDWGNEFLKDIDRPLSERGYGDAYIMADWCLKNKKQPACIVSSTAVRALSTALIFARTFEMDIRRVKLDPRIYESPVNRLINVIREQEDAYASIMLFGHNPSFTNISNELNGETFFDNVPTCGIVSFTFEAEQWSEVGPHKGKLNYHQFPKDFRNKT